MNSASLPASTHVERLEPAGLQAGPTMVVLREAFSSCADSNDTASNPLNPPEERLPSGAHGPFPLPATSLVLQVSTDEMEIILKTVGIHRSLAEMEHAWAAMGITNSREDENYDSIRLPFEMVHVLLGKLGVETGYSVPSPTPLIDDV